MLVKRATLQNYKAEYSDNTFAFKNTKSVCYF